MKKPNKRDTINLFFSAFLILAYIICAHFFAQFTETLGAPLGSIISILIFIVFGLLVFYATRVGDGKSVKRFSIISLIVLDIPALYIIVASLAPGLPLNDLFYSANGLSIIVILASIALGYGIPYTFLSGFEIKCDEVEEEQIVEGGIEADISDEDVTDDETEEELDYVVSDEENY